MKLMKMAGCQWNDVRELADKEGVEGALSALVKNGIYLTAHEFHGRHPVERGNTCFHINPLDLRNPYAQKDIPVRSSGSRSSGTPVLMDLAFFRDTAMDTVAYLSARESLTSSKAVWEVPGGVALYRILTLSCSGAPPEKWFSQLDMRSRRMDWRYRGSAKVLKLGGRLAGQPMPTPRYISLESPLPIIRWMRECLSEGRTPHLFTFASSAVRLCRYAYDAQIDLTGVQITMSGEPITRTRLETVQRSHAEAFPAIGSAECGYLGYGCMQPNNPDDMHFLKDLHALIQPGPAARGSRLRENSLLISSLRSSAPIVMLNVSLGDTASMERRECGCALGEMGLDIHIHGIRSFEKLTCGGMAFFDSDLIRILEVDLPSRFGGTPTDYQLVEEEDAEGKPLLKLIIHPRLGHLPKDKIKKALLNCVASHRGAEKLTAQIWKDGDIIVIESGYPITTSTGKIQHMHVYKPPE
ncbi:MAG: hypothetical protein JXE07_00235 [Candidatus Aminicenantes bacterium]|nr:hypothetical protein [Candidatus Aminicenantes bacterium]